MSLNTANNVCITFSYFNVWSMMMKQQNNTGNKNLNETLFIGTNEILTRFSLEIDFQKLVPYFSRTILKN